jgi:hypothetical protein
LSTKQFIASGIIEAYCLRVATEIQIAEVKVMELLHKDVQDEIELIQSAINNVRRKESKLLGNLDNRI